MSPSFARAELHSRTEGNLIAGDKEEDDSLDFRVDERRVRMLLIANTRRRSTTCALRSCCLVFKLDFFRFVWRLWPYTFLVLL